jgi:hypothetical protein
MKLIYTLPSFQHGLLRLSCAVQKRTLQELCKRDFMYVSNSKVVFEEVVRQAVGFNFMYDPEGTVYVGR